MTPQLAEKPPNRAMKFLSGRADTGCNMRTVPDLVQQMLHMLLSRGRHIEGRLPMSLLVESKNVQYTPL
jgi:hypothetical protein